MRQIINFIMKTIKLSDCPKGKVYVISNVFIKDEHLNRRLEDLFFKPNQKIKIKRENYRRKAFIVEVLGINYAIEKEICDEIYVYDA